MNAADKKKRIALYSFFYTALFCASMALAYYTFFKYDKTFIKDGDATDQHLKALLYYGRWLRTVAHSIFVEHRFEIPTYDFGIGYGGGIITTLSYYVIGDPITIFACLVPDAIMAKFYSFIIVVRLFCAGAAFSWYCFYRKKDASLLSVGVASVMYVFCAYVLRSATKHPYFMVPMIWLPLLLLGIDKIIREKKHILFIVSVAVSCLSNFYFFYMEVIFVVLYALFHVIKSSKNKIFTLVLMLRDGIVGVAIAAPILLPTIIQILGDTRSSMEYKIIPVYGKEYYRYLPGGVISSYFKGYWTIPGTTFLAGSCILLALLFLKKYTSNKVAIFLCLLTYSIPVCGYILNGMSYVSNRWNWFFVFCICILVVDSWEDLVTPSLGLIWKEWVLTIVMTAIFWRLYRYSPVRFKSDIILGVSLMLILLLIRTIASVICLKYQKGADEAGYKNKCKMIIGISVLLLTLFSLKMHGVYTFEKEYDNIAEAYVNEDVDIVSELINSPIKQIRENYQNEPSYRISGSYDENATLFHGLSSTKFYFSLSNPYICEFIQYVGKTIPSTYHYSGLEGRTFLNSLTGIKYLISKSDRDVPYGSVQLDEKLFENPNALPFIYGYDNVSRKADADEHTVLEKQEMMMQTAIVDSESSDADELFTMLSAKEVVFTSENVDYEISTGDNVTYDENTGEFVVTADNAVAHIAFEGKSGCETYLCADDVTYALPGDDDSLTYYLSRLESKRAAVQVRSISGGEVYTSRKMDICDKTFRWRNGIKDFVVNAGYSETALEGFELTFVNAGTYRLGNIAIKCQPVDAITQYVSDRTEGISAQVNFNDNNEAYAISHIDANVSLDKDKLLVINMPYEEAWTAYIDGKKAPIYRVNTMFSSVYMEAGTHTLELKYHTRGFGIGWFVSLVSICVLAFLIKREKKMTS
ncbi:YfhO family protein [Butyrivibrio sp. AE3006]|uniref:YfhO family protein n=1 Tax=Butyrivibrio sp. AE3006 TaxID=1280673 RepID=UPI000407F8DD|nr:YfhO family protein [Butyrivibrio sp. AE3006]